MVGTQSHKEIGLFVRDEVTGRFLFNTKALQALGIDPVQAQQRGYLMKQPSEAPETANVYKRDQTG